jgi:hypothetical protein
MVLSWILAAAAQNIAGLPVGNELGMTATYVAFTVTTLLPLTCA